MAKRKAKPDLKPDVTPAPPPATEAAWEAIELAVKEYRAASLKRIIRHSWKVMESLDIRDSSDSHLWPPDPKEFPAGCNAVLQQSAVDAAQILRTSRALERYISGGRIESAVVIAMSLGSTLVRLGFRADEVFAEQMKAATPKAQQANKDNAKARHAWVVQRAREILGASPKIKREVLAARIARASKRGCGKRIAAGTVQKILAESLPVYTPRKKNRKAERNGDS